jgi:cytochrome c553
MARGTTFWSSPGVRASVFAVAGLFVVSVLIGFVWLPSVHKDFTVAGLWASICRAAGVPQHWGPRTAAAERVVATNVVLDPSMAGRGAADSVGRGATVALQQCTMCHGAQGVSAADAPNLAGQYREVVIKQLMDYKSGHRRSSSIMAALAQRLSDGDIADVAAYYASLPKERTAAVESAGVPALVKVGDPLRNIAPCATCHGGIDHKLGAPWLEGMPKQYLETQLTAFASGARANDSHSQMRNMARLMSADEIARVSDFYARHGELTERR